MDKNILAAEIGQLVRVSHKKKEALIAFSEAVNHLSELYGIDRGEAFSVLAIMQSIVVGYTVDNSGDNPTLKDIIAEAEDILSKYAKGKEKGNK